MFRVWGLLPLTIRTPPGKISNILLFSTSELYSSVCPLLSILTFTSEIKRYAGNVKEYYLDYCYFFLHRFFVYLFIERLA